MPSTSKKQAKFMRAVAHGMKPKSGKGPSVQVAKEFVRADKKSDWRRNKARELNAPVSGWSDKMLEGMSKNERTKYAKK